MFRWAIAEGLRVDNPATVDALALPKVERPPVHRKALPYSEVSGCIEAVRASRASCCSKAGPRISDPHMLKKRRGSGRALG